MDERLAEEFEKWMMEEKGMTEKYWYFRDDEGGEYKYAQTHTMWGAWLAGREAAIREGLTAAGGVRKETRFGLGDEVRPELMSRPVRDWMKG